MPYFSDKSWGFHHYPSSQKCDIYYWQLPLILQYGAVNDERDVVLMSRYGHDWRVMARVVVSNKQNAGEPARYPPKGCNIANIKRHIAPYMSRPPDQHFWWSGIQCQTLYFPRTARGCTPRGGIKTGIIGLKLGIDLVEENMIASPNQYRISASWLPHNNRCCSWRSDGCLLSCLESARYMGCVYSSMPRICLPAKWNKLKNMGL